MKKFFAVAEDVDMWQRAFCVVQADVELVGNPAPGGYP